MLYFQATQAKIQSNEKTQHHVHPVFLCHIHTKCIVLHKHYIFVCHIQIYVYYPL